jgi:hypothetical protein
MTATGQRVNQLLVIYVQSHINGHEYMEIASRNEIGNNTVVARWGEVNHAQGEAKSS